jgi:hypothetical protein
MGNKNGLSFLSDEIVQLILAGVCIFLLAVLLIALIYPNFNKKDKTAESYFNQFNEAVKVADNGGTGILSVFQKDSSANYYLVYFGNKIEVQYGGINFKSVSKNSNTICSCYLGNGKAVGVCGYCVNLKYPVKENNVFELEQGKRFEIIKTKTENFYRITEKNGN